MPRQARDRTFQKQSVKCIWTTWIFVCAFVLQERDAPASGDSEPDAAGGSALSDDGALAVAKAQEALSLLPKLQDDAQDCGGGVEAAEVR